MNNIIIKKIADFQDFNIPNLKKRDITLPYIHNKADVIAGMRRSGKTWLCYQKIDELLKTGINKNRILYFNFEDDRLFPWFSVKDFELILQEYYRLYPENKNQLCFFFFDEIHNIQGWELFIRRIIDSENVKITLTGSNSKLLSREISTSLRGRSITTELFPLSFSEYLSFNDYDITSFKEGSKTEAFLRNAFDKYFEIGGFPEIQKESEDNRIRILQEYVNTVLFKDVVERYKIKNIRALRTLIDQIMNNPCKELSINGFYNKLRSMQISCTKDNLYEYLVNLEDSYLIYKVELYSNSIHKKQLNPPKMYVVDNGILKAMSYKITSDLGHLLENLVYLNLRRKNYQIDFFKNDKGIEADFVVRKQNGEFVDIIQVCYGLSDKDTRDREIRGIKTAMKELNLDLGKIITFNNDEQFENIRIIPIWKFLYS